ncbi:MAG TPA: hypothetical protein VMH32_06240 [Burkholderiales bacterium]|nr:hypothetical protein [Burkholderiales bacterium]
MRNTLLGAVVVGTAIVWTLVAHLLGAGVKPVFPQGTFFVIWALTAVGAFHAACGGIGLARASDESRSMHDAAVRMLDWRCGLNALRLGYIPLLAVVAAGCAAHASLGFDLTYEVAPVLQRAAETIRGAGALERTTLIGQAIVSVLLGMGAALLPAVAGLQVAAMNLLFITSLPSGVDGARFGALESMRRSLIASCLNIRRTGLAGWVLLPGVGALLLWSYAYRPEHALGGLYSLGCAGLLLWLFPPLAYVANRELSAGIYCNWPNGLRATEGSLIEGGRADIDAPR